MAFSTCSRASSTAASPWTGCIRGSASQLCSRSSRALSSKACVGGMGSQPRLVSALDRASARPSAA
eukprot:830318-Pleurochrysis_carterae.AAC.1